MLFSVSIKNNALIGFWPSQVFIINSASINSLIKAFYRNIFSDILGICLRAQ